MEWRRWLQRLADRGFWEANTGECAVPFDEGDIRREAAFRCWLRQLDLDSPPPRCLPDERDLELLALQWDSDYGPYAWWAWSIWSCCPRCEEHQSVRCPECRRLFAFADYSMQHAQASQEAASEELSCESETSLEDDLLAYGPSSDYCASHAPAAENTDILPSPGPCT